jgi:acyl-phosphate glycerol 3-phosphate acyltransferase
LVLLVACHFSLGRDYRRLAAHLSLHQFTHSGQLPAQSAYLRYGANSATLVSTCFMSPIVLVLLVSVGGYLVGGIPFGYLVARARGVDIFGRGSGNIGATNVGRVLGRRFGILVFVLDFAKGAIPAEAGLRLGTLAASEWCTAGAEILGVTAGLCAFLGHVFPVYLGFRGGKGVATGAGVVAVLLPAPFLAGLLTWITVLCAARYVSLASLGAAAALCLVRLLLVAEPLTPENLPRTAFCFLAAGLVFWRHRDNVGRLLNGSENRLRDSYAMNSLSRQLHLLALGVWLGSVVFFSFVVGPVLFAHFEKLGQDVHDRPSWFPWSGKYERRDDRVDGPKEQGTRAAGEAVTPLFPWYFGLQLACGLLALGTALGLACPDSGKVHRVRVWVLSLALATVLVGWLLEEKVDSLRGPRNRAVDAFLQSSPDGAEAAKTAALEAKADFGMWHGLSVLLNLGTLGLVTTAMLLGAWFPEPSEPAENHDKQG